SLVPHSQRRGDCARPWPSRGFLPAPHISHSTRRMRVRPERDAPPAPVPRFPAMTEHYEDSEEHKDRVLKNAQVLGFIAASWWRRPGLMSARVGMMLAAMGFDLALPVASGKLVDAVANPVGGVNPAWRAWALFVAVYFGFSVLRNLAMRSWIPLAA